ncbi:MAG: hypothetical protein M3P48_06000 [Actinomycetota bacterium]|nr:hypothetical protein [Actinomycetota bacterium]
MVRATRGLIGVVAAGALAVSAAPAAAVPDTSPEERGVAISRAGGGKAQAAKVLHQRRMGLLAEFPTGQVNSDLAFWGKYAYAGNYNGFRIYDISRRVPKFIVDFQCFGPQNDVSVWDRDRDGKADLLFTSVDRTLTGPECGATATEQHDDPAGWEGIRIFDISDPRQPKQIGSVYQDCGSHTHTLVPDLKRNRVLLYNASYPLRPGPTCGATRGPAAGRDPNHGVIQVVEVPLGDPAAAREIAEPAINYPGDPDNTFDPAEHGLEGFGTLRACHDIAVFVELRLVAGACAEQAQLWRMKRNGLPDTENPIWVYDDNTDTDGPGGGDVAADFWHSATFSWDGKIVNFSDESFGDGCPTVTPGVGDTGRTHFLDRETGKHLSHFMIPRPEQDAYCSTHQGNFVAMPGRYVLAQAWYMGGVDLVDVTNPNRPREIAYYDEGPVGAQGSDNWSHYWFERKTQRGTRLNTYGQDGVHNPSTGGGFQKFRSRAVMGKRIGLHHLNPQTQERVLPRHR